MRRAFDTLAGLLLVAAAPAFGAGEVGDFNFNETTGLINIPVAKVAPGGSVQINIGTYATGGQPSPVGLDIDEFFANDGSIRLVGGINDRVELSAMALHGGVFMNNRWLFGAKWLVLPDAPDHPAFAVGVQSLNAGTTNSQPVPPHFLDPSVFGVVSHSFPLNDSGMALDLHGGIGTGRLRNGFLGGEFHVVPQFSLIGETDGTIRSAGLKFSPNNRFDILTSVQFQRQETFLGFQLSYRIGSAEAGDDVAEEYESTLHKSVPDDVSPPETEKGPSHSDSARPEAGLEEGLQCPTAPSVVAAPEPTPAVVSNVSERPGGVVSLPTERRGHILELPLSRPISD